MNSGELKKKEKNNKTNSLSCTETYKESIEEKK